MSRATFANGDRVSLHPLEATDLDFVTEGVNHPSVRALVGQSLPTNRSREERYFTEMNERSDAVQLLIVAGEERVGVVELDPIDRETGVTELAVWIHPDRRRGGLAREAVELVVDYAFAELRLHKVTANAYAVNDASRGMLESLGFVQEGVGREDSFFDGAYHDTHYYGLLDEEWDRQRGDEDEPAPSR